MSPTAKVARTDCGDAASQGKLADERLQKERYQNFFFEKLSKACKDRDAVGSIVVVGIERKRNDNDEWDNEDDEDHEDDEDVEDDEDDEDEAEEGKEEKNVYSKEQLDSLRYIVVTKSRQSFLDKAIKMTRAGDRGTTSDGNEVIWNIIPWVNKAKKQKTLPLKFDAMFALTYALFFNDLWMRDNEMYGEGEELDKSVQALGKYWATLLAHTDAELGIDPEFTRPGILVLLQKFKEEVESNEAFEECKPFKWTK